MLIYSFAAASNYADGSDADNLIRYTIFTIVNVQAVPFQGLM